MKTKQLRSTKTITSALFAAAVLLSSSSVFAQVKIGSNPTTITPNANLDVEGVSNRHTVVLKSGHVGIGTTTPITTFQVTAVEKFDYPFVRNLVALFDPVGGQNFDSSAAIGVNGARAVFGYDVDAQQGKYAFLRGNQNTEIRLQVVDENSNLFPKPLVISGRTGSHGLVGINNDLPQSQLDVRGTTRVLASAALQTGNLYNGTSNMNGFEAVANTSTGDAYVGIQRSGGGAPLYLSKPVGAVTGQSLLVFEVGGSIVGSVTYTGTGVSFNENSDQRLKENIRTSKFGLEALKTVKVYDYNFKSDKNKTISTGVLAQELHKVYPRAVNVGGVDASTNPWQVDYSKLVPMLVKSVQELNQIVESLNQKVGFLEGEKAQLSADLKQKEAAYKEVSERISQVERMLGFPAASIGSVSK